MKPLLCIILLLAGACSVSATELGSVDATPGPRYRLMLAPHGTVGYVVQGCDVMSRSQYRILYGGGLSAEIGLSPRLSVAARGEIAWKNHDVEEFAAIRAVAWDVACIWLRHPERRATLFVSPACGVVKVVCPDARTVAKLGTGDYDFGSFTFIRLGIGHQKQHRSGVVSRFEFYVKMLFNEDSDLARLGAGSGGEPENAVYLGASLTIGIPLIR